VPFEAHGIFLTEKFLILAPVALRSASKGTFFRFCKIKIRTLCGFVSEVYLSVAVME
jgi:hypothetical protein